MLRIPSPVSDDIEALIHKVIGCCITVHRVLGPGLLETIYTRAISIELEENGIAFEREKQVLVTYRGRPLCHHRLDFVVGGQLVLEIKSVEHLMPVHRAQVLSYLGVSKLPVALLMNFNVPVLRDGIKRMVL